MNRYFRIADALFSMKIKPVVINEYPKYSKKNPRLNLVTMEVVETGELVDRITCKMASVGV